MTFKKDNFKQLLNTKFKVTFDIENFYDIELIKIIEAPPIPSLNIEPFSLLFRGDPAEQIFSQGSYVVFSKEVGSITLFMIPRMPDKEGIYYEVIFN